VVVLAQGLLDYLWVHLDSSDAAKDAVRPLDELWLARVVAPGVTQRRVDRRRNPFVRLRGANDE
jgi:hypothetical protein